MPTLTMPKLPQLPKFDAAELFEKADALQTKTLHAAEKFTADAMKRLPNLPQPLAGRLPAFETFQVEFFNRATKVQSANRVFVKRVLLGEVAPKAAATVAPAAAPTMTVLKPAVKPSAAKTAKTVTKTATKGAKKA